jgi:enoyl reductase-like protein
MVFAKSSTFLQRIPIFPIILQWTGGRAGGHHSFEDFHQPILATYRGIRQYDNISLVAGSGFGSADDVWEYLTGDWSVERFGVQPMAFDGFLFASRVMVAKEAHTSSSVKDLIVAAAGVEDGAWEGIIFNSETKLIDLTLVEERQDVAVPLTLQFQYCPSQGFAPIHEIASGRNERIKQFYWKLWFGDNEVLPNIDIHENFVGPDAAINSGDVEQFCAVAGNQGESFKVARNENVQAPMDFAIVTCWKVISIPFLHTLSLKYF